MTAFLRWCVPALLLAAPVSGRAAPTVRAADPRVRGLALASDGTDFLVVGAPCADAGPGLCATRVRGSGAVIEPAGFPLSEATVDGVAVAFGGSSYLVAWTGPGGVEYTMVSPAGVALLAAPVKLGPMGRTPAVASNGDGFMLVWEVFGELRWQEPQMKLNPISGVYQARVSAAGTHESTSMPYSDWIGGHSPTQYFHPQVAASGDGYQVIVQVLGYLTCDLVGTGTRSPIDPMVCLSPVIDLASDGTNYFMVRDTTWLERRQAGITSFRVGGQGALVSATATGAQHPVAAFDGQGFLVVWREGSLFASRLLGDGTLVDVEGMPLSEAGPFTDVDVASSSTTSLAIWSGGAAIFTPAQPRHLRLTPDASPLAGGVPARLTGHGLEPGAAVTVGGLAAPDAALAAPGVVTFTLPAHGAGAVDVVVTNPDGRSARLEAAVHYAAAPELATVVPACGPSTGRGRVTLVGAGFEPGMRVLFGHLRASDVRVLDDGHATCTTPPGAGVVPVTVLGAAGQSSTLDGAYLYEDHRPGRPDHRWHPAGWPDRGDERDGPPRR